MFPLALQNAYRREMPDPLFKNPYLPQWAVVLKDINLKRIKKTRTLEKGFRDLFPILLAVFTEHSLHFAGHILTQKRSWRKWHRLMSIDRTKAVTPLAVALQHFKVRCCITTCPYELFYHTSSFSHSTGSMAYQSACCVERRSP